MNRHCVECGRFLKASEEYVCDRCFTKQIKIDMEEMYKQHAEEENDNEDYSEAWRFIDSRGRSVFRGE